MLDTTNAISRINNFICRSSCQSTWSRPQRDIACWRIPHQRYSTCLSLCGDTTSIIRLLARRVRADESGPWPHGEKTTPFFLIYLTLPGIFYLFLNSGSLGFHSDTRRPSRSESERAWRLAGSEAEPLGTRSLGLADPVRLKGIYGVVSADPVRSF